jgi:inner membrane protein
MLAINHVTLSTALTLGLSIYFETPFFLPFIIFVAFATLLPDIDHPKSEISNFFPGINKVLPHRGITHSLLGIGLYCWLVYFLLQKDATFTIVMILGSMIGVYILGKIMEAKVGEINNLTKDFFSRKQMRVVIRSFTFFLDIFLLLLLVLVWKDQFRYEIASLLTIGYIGHVIGDFITKDGIPLLWPFNMRNGLKLFRTGGGFESFLGLVLFVANFWLGYVFIQKYGVQDWSYWQHYLNGILPVKI